MSKFIIFENEKLSHEFFIIFSVIMICGGVMGAVIMAAIVLTRVLDTCLVKIVGKNHIKNRCAHYLFEVVNFAVGVLVFLCVGGIPSLEPDTVMHGIILGTVVIIEESCLLAALECGPMALTMIIATSAMIIPIILARPLWGETLTVNQIIGTIIMLIAMAIILNVKDVVKSGRREEKDNPNHKKWTILVLILFLGNGAMTIDQKYQSVSAHADNIMGYLFVAFAVGAFLAFILFMYKRLVQKQPTEIKWNAKVSIIFVLCGILMALLYLLVTIAVGIMPLALELVINHGVTLTMLTILDMLVFKQKLKVSQYVGILLGITAIVILSL